MTDTDKKFAGVIKEWSLVGNGRIQGECVKHSMYGNGIADGQPITTSMVESITHIVGTSAKLCVTRNSIYVLV